MGPEIQGLDLLYIKECCSKLIGLWGKGKKGLNP